MFVKVVTLSLLIVLCNALQWDLVLDSDPETPHAKLAFEFPTVDKLSICVWYYPETDYYTVISYATRGKANAITIGYNETKIVILLDNKKEEIDRSLPVNTWTHLCLSWRNKDGAFTLHHNGKLVAKNFTESKGSSINGGGFFALGQDQDRVGGGFDATQGLRGRITEVNIWNRVISEETVENSYKCSPQANGNIVNWQKSRWLLALYAEPADTLLPCKIKSTS